MYAVSETDSNENEFDSVRIDRLVRRKILHYQLSGTRFVRTFSLDDGDCVATGELEEEEGEEKGKRNDNADGAFCCVQNDIVEKCVQLIQRSAVLLVARCMLSHRRIVIVAGIDYLLHGNHQNNPLQMLAFVGANEINWMIVVVVVAVWKK